MLLSKFLVPFTTRLARQNFSKLSSNLFSSRCAAADQKGKICPIIYETINPLKISGSKLRKEALEKCPKKKSKECKKGSSKESPCRNAPPNAAEVYWHAFKKVRQDALGLQILTRNKVDSLLGSMCEEVARKTDVEWMRMRQSLREIEAKVQEIVGMSNVCGAKRRNDGYAIGNDITARLQTWQCGNQAGLQTISYHLRCIECRVREQTDTAVESVRTCRGCVKPTDMLSCVEASSKSACSILQKAQCEMLEELGKLEELKASFIEENNRIVGDIMKSFERDANVFKRVLSENIAALKKGKMCEK